MSVEDDHEASLYRVQWTARARRSLHRLEIGQCLAMIDHVDGPIAENPHRLGKVLRLPPLIGIHSARRGEYRILYKILEGDGTIVVIDVQHRRDAYRNT